MPVEDNEAMDGGDRLMEGRHPCVGDGALRVLLLHAARAGKVLLLHTLPVLGTCIAGTWDPSIVVMLAFANVVRPRSVTVDIDSLTVTSLRH